MARTQSRTTIVGMGATTEKLSATSEKWAQAQAWRIRLLAVAVLGLAVSACVAQSIVVIGETPLPPPADIPTVWVAVLDDADEPVAGATIISEDQSTVSDETGLAMLDWRGQPMSVSIEAEGFFPGGVRIEEFDESAFELALRPVVLRGTVKDSSGFGLGGSTVTLGSREVVTDENGRFELSRATAGLITATRPGWHDRELEWDGEDLTTDLALAPRIIRGLHIGADTIADRSEWNALLEVAEQTVVNAFVIDVKNESGRVFYNSQVALAREVGAVRPLFAIRDVVDEMNERDLYKIARIVTFQDPIAARAKVDIAVYDTETESSYQKRGQYFLDPSDPVARAYGLDLGEEVCRAGFDEIQFDYVRYPDGYPDTVRFDVTPSQEVRIETISSFLAEAADRLHPLGCAVAGDVFGFTTSVNDDGGIGQQFSTLSTSVDVLSPMIYPSHYGTGWFGHENPNDHPASVVGGALDHGATRINGPAIVRPWLQDFYYDASQVREQIDEAESRALGWMLWNAFSNFQLDALDEDPASTTTTTGGSGTG